MKSLSEDVIMLILVKLPVKPLMRLRCVCKSWNHLIRNPSFIKMHQLFMKNSKNECILIKRVRIDAIPILCFHSYESLNVISPPMEIPHFNCNEDTRVYHSWPCNGLVLCALSTSTTCSLVLCNPSTREFKLIPSRPFCHTKEFNYRWHCLTIGLGFDSNTENYKVVALHGKYNEAEVYNLSTNTWRKIKHDKLPRICDEFESHVQGVPINGALHWTAYNEKFDYHILSFDVNTEMFNHIKLPKAITSPHHIGKSLTTLNNCLTLFACTHGCGTRVPKFVDIWVMKEYGVVDSWSKHARVSGGSSSDLIYPRLLWKNEALLVEIMRRKLEMWAMDTEEKSDTGITSYDDGGHAVMVYKESLVSLK